MTLDYWRENVNKLLEFNEKKVLQDVGTISKIQMKEKVYQVYDQFNIKRKEYEAKQSDLEDLKFLEETIKSTKKS